MSDTPVGETHHDIQRNQVSPTVIMHARRNRNQLYTSHFSINHAFVRCVPGKLVVVIQDVLEVVADGGLEGFGLAVKQFHGVVAHILRLCAAGGGSDQHGRRPVSSVAFCPWVG